MSSNTIKHARACAHTHSQYETNSGENFDVVTNWNISVSERCVSDNHAKDCRLHCHGFPLGTFQWVKNNTAYIQGLLMLQRNVRRAVRPPGEAKCNQESEDSLGTDAMFL